MANPTKLDREILVLGAVVIVGMLLAILDATIVNVAIPTLGNDLHASISTIQWVMTGYLLAFASTIPLTGWASERFGVKRVWIASLLVFLAGSALSGLAWSIDALIVSRVIQGAGAGLLMPVGQTILAQAAGPQRIGRVMSVIGVPLLLGPIFGPIIGGAIVGGASWRWIFFVNLPVGLVALALAWRLLPASAPRLGQRLDLRGLLLLSPGLALFVYGMAEAGSAGGFGRHALVGISAGLALVIVFVRHALQLGKAALIRRRPLPQPRLRRSRGHEPARRDRPVRRADPAAPLLPARPRREPARHRSIADSAGAGSGDRDADRRTPDRRDRRAPRGSGGNPPRPRRNGAVHTDRRRHAVPTALGCSVPHRARAREHDRALDGSRLPGRAEGGDPSGNEHDQRDPAGRRLGRDSPPRRRPATPDRH